jgi:hypothetical protein
MSKLKNKISDNYIKLGYLNKSIANKLGISSKGIYISKNYLRHVEINHKKELSQLGISAIGFISYVVDNFNHIYKGTKNSYLLVVYDEKISKVAAIELNLSLDTFWEVKTAEPRGTATLKKKPLLWKKERTL